MILILFLIFFSFLNIFSGCLKPIEHVVNLFLHRSIIILSEDEFFISNSFEHVIQRVNIKSKLCDFTCGLRFGSSFILEQQFIDVFVIQLNFFKQPVDLILFVFEITEIPQSFLHGFIVRLQFAHTMIDAVLQIIAISLIIILKLLDTFSFIDFQLL